MAISRFYTRPPVHQEFDLILAPDERAQRDCAHGLETALDHTRPKHLAYRHGSDQPLDLDPTQIAILKEIADQSLRAFGDYHGVRRGRALQPCSEVRSLVFVGLSPTPAC